MMEIWDRPPLPVTATPFDHVVVDDFLAPDLFAALARTFPDCPRASGPTGFTLHKSDDAFDRLMASNSDWRAFYLACDSQRFVDFMIGQFASCFRRECVADLSHARHVAYRESRADKERRHIRKIEHAIDQLWVRFDFMQGKVGYHRVIHLDHRRRAATVLVYCNGPENNGMDGGSLVLHGQGQTEVVVAPRANRAVMFPCHNSSWHSVTPILRQTGPRNSLQITLSSSMDLWAPLPDERRPPPRRFVQALRKLARGISGSVLP